jgi:isoleucyl-tRNA synthetase
VTPQEVIKDSGAEVLRLWVAMSDYSEELRVGREILTRVVEAYRKLRNTCRILVANLYDFDPQVHLVPIDRLHPIDRYAVARFADAAQKMRRAYDEYDFPTVFQTLTTLVSVDLSAFYVDVTKDRMYTFAAASPERRSTQTAMYIICDGLARLLAPILPVTAEDLWRYMPGARTGSVHLELFPTVDHLIDPAVVSTWSRLLEVRDQVNAALEQKRKEKLIGNSLSAHVTLTASGPIASLLHAHEAQLPTLFIVSDLTVTLGAPDGPDAIAIEVDKARGVKCDRCWRLVPHVRSETEWAGICDRCVDALAEPVKS